jgi:hypothetical protein
LCGITHRCVFLICSSLIDTYPTPVQWVETEIEGGESQTESALGSSDLGASGHSSQSAVENSGESSGSVIIENETEFSLGLDDLDFLSKGHHSKNRNFPKIHFGNEDANSREPSNDSSDDSSDDASERSAITSKTVMPPRRTLYIQMEVRSAQLQCREECADQSILSSSSRTLH